MGAFGRHRTVARTRGASRTAPQPGTAADAVFDRDGQTQSELLESVGLDHSTVSKSLRRMQAVGLLVREPAAQDRRVMVVHLTDKSLAMREPIAGLWHTLKEASARNLSKQQRKAFIDTAYAITGAIQSRAHAG